MSGLAREDRTARPDDLYQLLVEAHAGLSPDQSRRLDASLVLLLLNHIGDFEVAREAVAAARHAVLGAAETGSPGG